MFSDGWWPRDAIFRLLLVTASKSPHVILILYYTILYYRNKNNRLVVVNYYWFYGHINGVYIYNSLITFLLVSGLSLEYPTGNTNQVIVYIPGNIYERTLFLLTFLYSTDTICYLLIILTLKAPLPKLPLVATLFSHFRPFGCFFCLD